MAAEIPSSDATSETHDAALYEALGGMEACQALVGAFYARVPGDPVLGPMHSDSLRCATERLTHYLAQFLGGPAEYAQERWSLSLREAHLRFVIGPKEREAWLKTMSLALDEMKITEPMRSALYAFFERASAHIVNQPRTTADSATDTHVVEPRSAGYEDASDSTHDKLTRRWTEQQALEAAVDAVRNHQTGRALQLIESPEAQALFARDHAAWLSLLAILSGADDDALTAYVRQRLDEEPGLAQERYTYGRTLLHEVAGLGSLTIVEELLRLGADPNAADMLGKTPLYMVGNGCMKERGAEIVRALVKAGADVDARESVKGCVALHMATRRGNIGVARALLECGANLEARDNLGDTPLRRAVNCAKAEVAALLLSYGADAHSRGSRGLTPRQAARSAAMKQVFAGS